jgi:hypothetical protein
VPSQASGFPASTKITDRTPLRALLVESDNLAVDERVVRKLFTGLGDPWELSGE